MLLHAPYCALCIVHCTVNLMKTRAAAATGQVGLTSQGALDIDGKTRAVGEPGCWCRTWLAFHHDGLRDNRLIIHLGALVLVAAHLGVDLRTHAAGDAEGHAVGDGIEDVSRVSKGRDYDGRDVAPASQHLRAAKHEK